MHPEEVNPMSDNDGDNDRPDAGDREYGDLESPSSNSDDYSEESSS